MIRASTPSVWGRKRASGGADRASQAAATPAESVVTLGLARAMNRRSPTSARGHTRDRRVASATECDDTVPLRCWRAAARAGYAAAHRGSRTPTRIATAPASASTAATANSAPYPSPSASSPPTSGAASANGARDELLIAT